MLILNLKIAKHSQHIPLSAYHLRSTDNALSILRKMEVFNKK